jgi:hypothetical protein
MLRLVQPHELRQSWGFVKNGLEIILKKSPEPWIPEDVYAAVIGNKANLWLVIEDNHAIGFVLGYISGDNFHIWCAWGNLNGNLKGYFQELEDIAKTQCKRMTFDSWRPGWNRVAKELGFKPRTWAKEL